MTDHDPQRYADLATFGEELRREREIRGISLKEIADATKISKRFLEAIENNDHRTLPAPVFTRGFVREYARYLGLNFDEIVNRYNQAAQSDDRIEKPQLERLAAAPPRDIAPPPPRKKGIPPAYARVDSNVFLLIFIVAALAGATWWAVQHRRAQAETVDAGPPVMPAAVKTATVAPPVVDSAPPPEAEPLKMIVEATDDCWVSLEVDGESAYNDEMKQGERHEYTAKEQFRFKTIGNAAGVILTFNSIQVPPLGPDGRVIKNKTFDRPSLEALRRQENDRTQ
jgi:transcriptional regulator with XRE-family HTH domain